MKPDMLASNLESPIYRIRFHGRGGQGMKTASRILGKAFFLEGFEVQDAPRYGAERRGAPIFAYVRASRKKINERGIIRRPDLVVVADDTLIGIPSAGVLQGISRSAVVLIYTSLAAHDWQNRYELLAKVVTLPRVEKTRLELRLVSALCAGAAARLTGVISRDCLQEAVQQELAGHGRSLVQASSDKALEAYERMTDCAIRVSAGTGEKGPLLSGPDWIKLPFEPAQISAPTIHAARTSESVATGLWRTMRPVINESCCQRCGLCGSYCPEGAISWNERNFPEIDYMHCKGCMICVVECPAHAIHPQPEPATEKEGK
jgi:pyruvate ferredoxin oxidoreductase gamma subunit